MLSRNRLNWNKELAKCPTLSKDEVKTLVVDDKWLGRRRHHPLRDGPYQPDPDPAPERNVA